MATTVSTTSELKNAVANAGPGSEIIATGGTYNMSSRWTITSGGETGNPLVIRAAAGEQPHIQFASGGEQKDDSGIQIRGPNVIFRDFEVSGSGWKGVNTAGNANNSVLENLSVHGGNLWGIMNNGCDNVVFRNCDSYDNFDPQNGGGNSDGFNMTGPARNGLIEGCRSWNNGDDGYDMWISEDHTIRNCWAWENGRDNGDGNGFKLGGGPNEGGGHLVHHCVAYNNSYRGFDWNTTDRELDVYNCTAVDNQVNYRFNESGPYTLRNNISVNGVLYIASDVDDEYNSWNLDLGEPVFKSTDPFSDDFLQLSSSSPYADAGVDVGLSFEGDAPSLGAFEPVSVTLDEPVSRVTLDDKVTLNAGDAKTDSLLETEHSGFNNDGYVNFVGTSGAVAKWEVEVPEADQYKIEIRYANGGDYDRTANLTFSGIQTLVTFPQTAGWTDWSTISGTLDLPSGPIDLAIETTGQDAGNLDQITIWPVGETEANKEIGDTPNHGFATPELGQEDWHVPLNENFRAIDRSVPIVDEDGAKDQYDPAERAVFIAMDTGLIYIGNGSQWNQPGKLI